MRKAYPHQVAGLPGVKTISAGDYHSVAIASNGTLWAWGYNYYGQLGDGTTTDQHTPVPVSGVSDLVSISAGQTYTIALKSDGTAYSFGDNFYGELGDGTYANKNTPAHRFMHLDPIGNTRSC